MSLSHTHTHEVTQWLLFPSRLLFCFVINNNHSAMSPNKYSGHFRTYLLTYVKSTPLHTSSVTQKYWCPLSFSGVCKGCRKIKLGTDKAIFCKKSEEIRSRSFSGHVYVTIGIEFKKKDLKDICYCFQVIFSEEKKISIVKPTWPIVHRVRGYVNCFHLQTNFKFVLIC